MAFHMSPNDRKKARNTLWSDPDPLLTAAGASGEFLVAKVRLLLTAVLMLIPVANLLLGANSFERAVGFSLTSTAVVISLIVYLMIERGFNRPWLGLITSCLDVTLVSSALATFLLLDQPHSAINSKVVFEGYFIAIGATCLRNDRRVCAIAGFLAIGEYWAIAAFAATNWDLNNAIYAPYIYGLFSWNSQISRLILILTASLLSIAVVSRTRELLRLATSDPLTRLFNRAYVSERVGVEFSRAWRYRRPIAIAMVDVDNFKSFNDKHGHAAGDLVLKSIADALRSSFRKSDIVGRYGGDEFVIVMPETDARTAARKLDAFRETIANAPIHPSRTGKSITITVSAGLAGFPDDGTKQEDLLAVADARLFKAKDAGRNRIVSDITHS